MHPCRMLFSCLAAVALVGCVDQPTVPPDADVQFNVSDPAADKTVLCHKPGTPAEGTLEVATAAAQAHLDHGDILGACGGTGGDACTAINDFGYDGQYAFVELENLIFQGDEKVTLHLQCGELCNADFDLFVKLSPTGTPRYFDNWYWTGSMEQYVHVELPDCWVKPASCWLGGWRTGPLYLAWGTDNWSFTTWQVSCEHVPGKP